jgi:hypothetical protein
MRQLLPGAGGGAGAVRPLFHWSMIQKSGDRFSEKITLIQRDEIMMRFDEIAS